MTETTVPSDYDPDDAFDDDRGIEQCPHCESVWSFNGGLQGPAFTVDGREFEFYTEAEPGQVLFCESCWRELETNRKQAENSTLSEWEE